MLTIYSIPVSLYCAKLRILLRHKKLEWREVPPPGGYGSDAYKTIVPSGNLPALDDDGLLIGDSEAIAEYLNEKFPDPPMLPDDLRDRARVRELSRFHDTRLEPEVRRLFSQIDPSVRDKGFVDVQSASISVRLGQLGRMLENHRAADRRYLTLGDCGYPVTFTWIEMLESATGFTVEWPQAILDYSETLGQQAAVNDEIASYRPALKDWIVRKSAS
jgi:glutathione S-transferase/maleylpyruvate isomerase